MFLTSEVGVGEYKGVQVVRGPQCCTGGIRGYGSTVGGVVFVGISPARHETGNSQRPLTGPSGKLLDACLEAIELKRQDYYCTNIVCKWMNEPSMKDIEKCESRLENELYHIKPKLIVLMGKIVSEQILKRPFGKVRGAVQWSEKFNAYIMATYHPSAILQGMGDTGSSKDDKASTIIYDFIRDLKKIKQVVEWKPKAPESKALYTVVETIHGAQFVLNYLSSLDKNEPIALDVETTYTKDDEEADAFQNEVLCVGVGTSEYAWVFTPSALYDSNGESALEWPKLHWTMHNAIFDTGVMRRRLGVWIDVAEDTMLQSYSLDERSGVHRLKTLAREYLAAGFYEDDRFYNKLTLDQIPKEMLYEYNAKDVVYTARLSKKFKVWQIADNVRDFYLDILIPAVNMYKEAQYHGINIDENILLKFTWLWGNDIVEEESALQELAREAGLDHDINLQSSQQLAELLYQVMGIPCVKYTKGGKPSVDKEVIDQLKDQNEFVRRLERLRRLYKMWSTYVVKLPLALKEDGRAHPVVKLHGQTGGRPSYTGVAVQTFVAPSHPSEFNTMRTLIKAPPYTEYEGTDGYIPPEDDEYVLVEVDYGKAELWVAQSYSDDEQMLLDLLSGDYHTNVAMDILNKIKELVTKDDRTTAKRTSFGILYDIEEVGLAKQTKSTIREARERIKRWNARNSDYHRWALDVQNQIRKTGELVSYTGRKRRIIILGNDNRAAKQAVNYPIQSTSSDIVLKSAVLMHPRIKRIGGHILFTVHDSIVTKCLKSRLLDHCNIMHDIMTMQHYPQIKPIPVEIKVGYSWGDVEGIHDCSERQHKPNRFDINMDATCTWETRLRSMLA